METRQDRLSACRFFYSKKPEYAYHRHLWFATAGIPEPTRDEMDGFITHLVAVGFSVRKAVGRGRKT